MPGKLGIIYMVIMPGGIMSGKLPLTWVGGTYLSEGKNWKSHLLVCITTYFCSLNIPAPLLSTHQMLLFTQGLSKDSTYHENQTRLLSVSDEIWIPPLLLGCLTIILHSLVLRLLSSAMYFTSKLFWH